MEQTVKFTKREILEAAEYNKDAFPFSTTCAECDNVWAAHLGRLCPAWTPTEMAQEYYRMTARGEVPPEAWQREFKWAGTLFVPLLDTGEVGRVYFDLVN